MRIHPPLKVLVDAQNKLGEGIVGSFNDDNSGTIAWVDIDKQEVHLLRLNAQGIAESHRHKQVDAQITWGAVEAGQNFAFFARDTVLYYGAHSLKKFDEQSFHIPDCPENHRTNDGRMHHSGHYWFGTMAADDPTNNATSGGIYYSVSGMPAKLIFPGIRIPNAICFSPSGERMYFTDSPTRIISRFPVDPATGAPAMEFNPNAWKDKNSPLRRSMVFIDLDDHLAHIPESSHPDGAITHADGSIFLALACLDFDQPSSAVARFSPAGKLTDLYPVPTPVVTCPFIDVHGYLYATSAQLNMTKEQLGNNPTAGALWRTPYPVVSAE
ncbi:MAG: SMP-30/gluconolactonase/LRE family protein [Actinomycetia bacterium]|nr:SMP-30/gluconolactonase/LRE family protein [Actinomycetes bacterium]